MNTVVWRFLITRVQPISIISAIFLPDVFDIHIISWQAASMLVDIKFLSLILTANFFFFVVLDWKNTNSPAHMRSISMIYTICVGYFAAEVIPIISGSLFSIFSAANAVTPKQQIIIDFIVVYGLVGTLLFEIYIHFIPRISLILLRVFRLKNKRQPNPINL